MMKLRRTIYLVIGCIFVFVNLLFYLVALMHPNEKIGITPAQEGDPAYMAGHYFGMNLFMVTGLIFLYASYRLNKKIKRKELEDIVDSI
jgi:hypothetical protein